MPRRWLHLVTALLWAVPQPAQADDGPARVAIHWPAGQQCLQAESIIDRAAAKVRRHIVSRDKRAHAIVIGRARFIASGWQITLELRAADSRQLLGTRELEVAGAGCEAALEHAALVIAMLVDSSVVAEVANHRSAVQVSDPESPPSRVATRAPHRHYAGIGLAVEAGRLPNVLPGLQILAGARPVSALELEVALGGYWPTDTASTSSGGKSELTTLLARGQACAGGAIVPGLRVSGCTGLVMYRMAARGSGFVMDQAPVEWLLDAALGAHLERVTGSRGFVRLATFANLAIVRPAFGYLAEDGQFQQLYTPSLLALTASASFGLRF